MLAVVLRVVVAVVARLPWRSLAWLGGALGWLAGSVLRIRRSAVVAAMERASIPHPSAEASAMYAGLGTGLFELFWLSGASPARRERALREHVVLDEDLAAAILAARARGPLVLAASHTANWELVAYGAARTLATRGARLAIVAKPLSVGAFHAFCTKLRTACGLVLIAPAGALTEARRVLAAGDVVAMPIDQVPDRAQHGVGVSFLGAAALADRAPAALARSLNATFIVVGASRDGGTHRAHLLAELHPAGPASAWVPETTREATRLLDGFVRQNPAAWLWLHRRWRPPLELRTATRAARLVATGHPG
ncbi:MAG TPA: lysophospholipid acyltransferase family protein [Labilithrix sp.]|nr:lysophospholipid acyltransferase family protein [Labilithrix sp.]